MPTDLVRVRNRETGEELLIGQSHLTRWPDDPYDVIDGAPAPSASGARGELPAAYAGDNDYDAPVSRP